MIKHGLTTDIATLLKIKGVGLSGAANIIAGCGSLENAKKTGSKLERGRIKGIGKEKSMSIFKQINK